jgi:DNA-binding response OmpR family regulator
VLPATDGKQALQRWETDRPDIVLLDAGLPKLNGFEVCRRIRHEFDASTPIIMVTGYHDEEKVLYGFSIGADDYVTKPFSAKQLKARMKAVVRRSQGDSAVQPATALTVGDITLDPQSYEVTRAGRPIRLTPLEFRLLYILAMNSGRVIPYARLVEYAWGYDGGDSSLIKTHICHIREKMGLPASRDGGIRSVPGIGYSFTAS